MAPKRKQASNSVRRSPRLAKKARVDSPEPEIEAPEPDAGMPEVKIESPEPEEEIPLAASPGDGLEQESDTNGTDADDEAEDVEEEESEKTDDDGTDGDDEEESSESEWSDEAETDYEDYMADSDDPWYHEIRRLRDDDKVLPELEPKPLLITTLRCERKRGRGFLKDKRLEHTLGTKRLPNLVTRNGEAIFLPLEIFSKIFNYLDRVAAVSVSLTNIANFGLYHDRFGGKEGVSTKKITLFTSHSVKPWETGIFEKPLSRPARTRKVCVRDVIHSWFPKTLTFFDYGQNPIYHGPKSLKILKRYIRRTEAEVARKKAKAQEERHEARRQAKGPRQEARRNRIEMRRERREARFQRICQEHEDDSEYSDDHDCLESKCALNYTDAEKPVTFEDSGRDSWTESESVESSDDDGQETDDSEFSGW
ncbi:hypothetical protein EAF04_001858 [Stromatinia cepivora]|nr:hypothetical protein EAF04_001858 [Stromatinia cepivora]